jgi:hypothetical protein
VSGSITPATRIWSSARTPPSKQRYSWAWRGVGEREHEAADPGLADDRQDLGERHVQVVRALVIAPADVHADALARDIDQRPIDRRDHALDEAEELR